MDLHRYLRSLALLIFILATYFSTVLARHHPIRHRHYRHKRQHAHSTSQYLPGSYVVEGNARGPDSGNWGPWSEPSDCSRSCGGGVAYQTRRCRDISDTGAELCQGGTKRYFSCNIQDCPEVSTEFRAEQCAEFNAIPFEGRYYKWVPYTKAPNKCELNCMPKGERFYFRHKRKVIDGTRCDEEKLDICVDGHCMPVGCDMMLGSTAREDKCRECGGDGSSCNTVEGLLEMDDLQVGYNDILLIPTGATNIHIQEIQASNNYLAIRNVTGHYYLNGNWRIDFPRSLKFAGTIFHYERKPHGFFAPESLTALGPTTEPIYIVLLYQETNPGVQYEYSIPKGVAQQTDPDSYSWISNEFSTCSATCGGGYQIRNVTCARRKDLDIVPDYLCDPSLEPTRNQTCNTIPCPPRWFLGEWGACSSTCGKEGIQIRQVYCEQIVSGGLPSVVEDSLCLDILAHKPSTTQKCGEDVPCPTWHVGPWKPCNRLCGEGMQKRRVRCFQRMEGRIDVLGDSGCAEKKPEEDKPCELRPCEGVDWVVSDWSGCEDKCGLTQETRKVHCANQVGKLYPDEYCHAYRLPELTRSCESPVPCEHEWFASQWSECSAHCGSGIKTRKVFCGEYAEDIVKRVPDEKCDIRKKYEAVTNCTGKEECAGQWYTGPWSACDAPCGGGRMTRKVLCYVENATMDVKNCDPSLIHFSSETCNNNPCTKDQVITMEPSPDVSDEDEECEEDIEGSFITMETTLGLNVTPVSGATGIDKIFEGSGDEEYGALEFDTEATSQVSPLTTTDGVSFGSTEIGSSLSSLPSTPPSLPSSPVSGTSELEDIMLSDSTGVSDTETILFTDTAHSKLSTDVSSPDDKLSTVFSSSGDKLSTDYTDSEETGSTEYSTTEGSASTDFSSSEDTLGTDFSSSEDTLVTDFSSFDTSSDSSSIFSRASTSDYYSSVQSSSSIDLASVSPTLDTTESTLQLLSSSSDTSSLSSDASSDQSSSTSSEFSTVSTVSESSETSFSTDSTINSSFDLTSDDGSGMTATTDFETEVTSYIEGSGTGSTKSRGIPFFPEGDFGDLGSGDEISSTIVSSVASEISSSTMSEESTPIPTEVSETTVVSSFIYTSESSPETTETSVSGTETTESRSTESHYTESHTTESETSETETATDISITTETSVLTTEALVLTSESSATSTESPATVSSYDTSSTSSSLSTEEFEESTTEYLTSEESTPTASSSEVTTTEYYTSTEVSEETSTEIEAKTTLTSAEKAITKEQKVKKCKRKKKKPKPEAVTCKETEFGCCPDGKTTAQGPFSKGCQQPETCEETEFGCCPDGVSPAGGKGYKDCPPSFCAETLFGCCPDGIHIAEGNYLEGCEKPKPDCKNSEFGCCPDGITQATGTNNTGCFECEGSGECDTCNVTKYGCCPDGVRAAVGPDDEGCEDVEGSGEPPEVVDCSNSTYGCCPDGIRFATGPNFEGCGVIKKENCTASYFGCCPDGESPALGPRYEGCRMPCEDEPFGCCSDGITPAHGPNHAGCCLTTPYGCCPDNIVPARGPNLEDCGCQYSTYGCCPDNLTIARGPNAEGCGCQYTKYGCCPNRYAPAAGPEFEGCACHTYQFGCCPDGITISKGPYNQGCGCENTEYGCCPDDRTPAPGPNKEGCGCEASKYGCCPDGQFEAQGEKFEGCKEVPVLPGEACTQNKDRGNCRDFKVKWFFDMEYGGCSRFWYGGCSGNDNRFSTQDECKESCVEPPGRDACFLTKIEGPCEGYYPHWYYDIERKQCGQFIYGGCLGNNNRFETREKCEELCVTPDTLDVCEQPKLEGPCRGNFSRWYYDQQLRMCQEFTYGGCHGNRNNFFTETECQHQCLKPYLSRVMDNCALPKDMGPCPGSILRWYYDSTVKGCKQFMYGGCQGNGNRFKTEEECKTKCHVTSYANYRDYCALPRDEGNCTERHPRWFFEAEENRCMPFYYSGCGGNDNTFETQQACETDCPSKFEQDICLLPAAAGECHNYTEHWYYDSYHVRCTPFYYGGCGGNENNFLSMEACQRRCESGYITPEPELSTDICDLPRVVGPCSGSIIQWYYDRNTASCYEFDYGGCQGNANRFNDRQQCEEYCKVIGSTAAAHVPSPLIYTTQKPYTIPDSSTDICGMTVDTGPCDNEQAAWYYNRTSSACHAFIYSGCGGNANRFESEEQCERQCGNFRGQDVCNLPADVGPCRAYFRKWHYNSEHGECEEFVFGGCQGNGNRFSTQEECEHICLHRDEPGPKGNATSHQAICRLPVDTGPCTGGYYKRWYFDEDRMTCIPFIYSGCAGNRNRFRNFQTCLNFCFTEGQTGNEVGVDTSPEKPVEDPCQSAKIECQTLRCPYLVEKYMDSDFCEKCQCHDPCRDHTCPDGTQCAVDLFQNPRTGETEFRAACRPTNKPGKCPRFSASTENCVNECKTDADCTGNNKCCHSGCVSSCLSPVFGEPLTTEGPRLSTPQEPAGAEAPRIEDAAVVPRVQAQEGSYITLQCIATGNPTPTITWRKGAVTIDGSGRYKQLLNGSLQIIGLYRKDTGVYICIAENGIGYPVQREYHLEVTEPTSCPAEVIGEDKTYVVVTLGAPTILQCYAVGWPPPTVTWWRGDRMLPLSSEQYEQRRDYSLLIRSVTLRNLGHYTCQAYNGHGRAASWTVTVQAVGPVYSGSPGDSVYNEFLIPSPKKPDVVETPLSTRPSYPFRPWPPIRRPRPSPSPAPYRPPPPPPPEPTTAPEIIPQPVSPPGPESQPEGPRVFTVPVQATISLTRTVYPIGSDISIPCDVDGYPIPNVEWYKDDIIIEPADDRIQITENHRLLLVRANGSDAGTYKCYASNQYGSHYSTVFINVQGIYIHPNCTDNPFFANCRLIVAGQYCTHKYYARFCCKSCTQAGQLPSYGPHLEKTAFFTRKPLT